AIVLQKILRILCDTIAVIFRDEALIGRHIVRWQKLANIVLLADEDELPRRARIGLAQEVPHGGAEILQTELGEILRRGDIGIEGIICKTLALRTLTLAITANQKTGGQQNERRRNILQHALNPTHGKHPRRSPSRWLQFVSQIAKNAHFAVRKSGRLRP